MWIRLPQGRVDNPVQLHAGRRHRNLDGLPGRWASNARATGIRLPGRPMAIASRSVGMAYLDTRYRGRRSGGHAGEWIQCSGPSWSPAGDELAFAAQFSGRNGIYLAPVAGGAPRLVYGEKGACEPHFTPDGNLIIYETESNIFTIQPNGEKNRMVTFLAGVQRYGRPSPDGAHIVYCQGVSESGPWELYVAPLAGGYPTRLTEGGSDMNPIGSDPMRAVVSAAISISMLAAAIALFAKRARRRDVLAAMAERGAMFTFLLDTGRPSGALRQRRAGRKGRLDDRGGGSRFGPRVSGGLCSPQ